MKKDYTHIVIVQDRSGSMTDTASDVIGGFNTFVKEQAELPGTATLTLVQFDHDYLPVHLRAPIATVPPLDKRTYAPRGSTALYDAIGRAVTQEGQLLAAMAEDERPEKVLFVIMTDGYENASREFSEGQIRTILKEQRDKYSWQIVFIGANIDVDAVASTISVDSGATMDYQGAPMAAYASLSVSTNSFRGRSGNGLTGAAGRSMPFFDKDAEDGGTLAVGNNPGVKRAK